MFNYDFRKKVFKSNENLRVKYSIITGNDILEVRLSKRYLENGIWDFKKGMFKYSKSFYTKGIIVEGPSLCPNDSNNETI